MQSLHPQCLLQIINPEKEVIVKNPDRKMRVFKYQHVMLLVIDNVSVIKNWHLDTPDKPLDAVSSSTRNKK